MSIKTSTYRDLKAISLPQEMRGQTIKPGAYSIHYCGEEAGAWLEWDGRTAEALVDADQDEALAVGAGDTETGEVPTLEVAVLLIDAEGDCYEIDRASL